MQVITLRGLYECHSLLAHGPVPPDGPWVDDLSSWARRRARRLDGDHSGNLRNLVTERETDLHGAGVSRWRSGGALPSLRCGYHDDAAAGQPGAAGLLTINGRLDSQVSIGGLKVDLTAEEIQADLGERLVAYKRPRPPYVLGDFPRTATGKIVQDPAALRSVARDAAVR